MKTYSIAEMQQGADATYGNGISPKGVKKLKEFANMIHINLLLRQRKGYTLSAQQQSDLKIVEEVMKACELY